MSLSILHANSNILMSFGLKSLLMRGGGVKAVTNVSHETQLFQEIENQEYDVIVVDPNSKDHFSTDTIIKLRERSKTQKLLIISSTTNTFDVLKVLEKGVEGYLTRECDEDEIVHAIFSIAKGEKFYCNKVMDIILNKQISPDEDNCEPTALTQRETEITALIAKGMTNKAVAEQLHLSPHTVHTHRKNILRKLGINSVSELTLYAINVGLIAAEGYRVE
jgi:DNA-binding NarL/FixJ family response regulator